MKSLWSRTQALFENNATDVPWQILAAKFCVTKKKGVNKAELVQFLIKKGVSEAHANRFFEEEILAPVGRPNSRFDGSGEYSVPLEMVSKITDYEELKLARKNSINAWRFSVAALVVAVVGSLAQVIALFW